MMNTDDLLALRACVGSDDQLITAPTVVQRLSRDFYWYSPILKPLLDAKTGEAVVQPVSPGEIRAVLATCYARKIPVTARGAGTGNYGQAIPLEGGVVLDLQRMETIHGITDGVAEVDPGVKLGALENHARTAGYELRCFPSTVAKASVGGFLGGGSGGIGSVAHGGLRDFGTVHAIEVVTMEAEPRTLRHEGDAVHAVMHSWGTNGIITRIWLRLTPAVDWAQCALSFPSFDAAYEFTERIAYDGAWMKRLATVFESPIPSFFTPIKALTRPDQSLAFFLIAATQLDALTQEARQAGAEITLAAPYLGLRTQPLLSDYTWNHTTLWAMKADPAYTYLQCGFNRSDARAQLKTLKDEYGPDFLHHMEFMKIGTGDVIPGAIPVVRFSTPERLNEMIEFCRGIGVSVANPHSNHVEGGGRYRPDNIQLQTKRLYDPANLLNPGKMASFTDASVEPAPLLNR
jgi:FAD/FMN-containing dehydrogenase